MARHRTTRAAAVVASVCLAGGLASLSGAPAVAQTICGELPVTIDLADPGHADPDRPESDVIAGTDEWDRIRAGAGDDTICAGDGWDTVWPGDGDDTVFGQAGNDDVFMSSGEDVVNGGAEDAPILTTLGDRILYQHAPSAVRVDLRIDGSPQNTGGGGTVTLVSVEDVVGSDHDDTLLGDEHANGIEGRHGRDRVRTFGGADVVSTVGAQADVVDPGPGADEVHGWGAHDVVTYATAPSRVHVDLRSGQASGGAGADLLIHVERVQGSAYADRLAGGAGADGLSGGRGADVLLGRGGADLLDGGPGRDRCLGGAGMDTLRRCAP